MLSKTRGLPGRVVQAEVCDPATGSGCQPAEATGRALSGTAAAGPTHTCSTCALVLRVTGLGRHRVYFEVTNHLLDDPVMDRVCPGCRQILPGN